MISIIVCSIDQGKFASVCASYRRALAGETLEIVGIHDAKSLAEGYNRGVRQSRGEVLIFSHDDIEFVGESCAPKLRSHLQRHDLLGVAGTTRLVGPRWVEAGPPYVYGQIAQISQTGGGYDVAIWNAAPPATGEIQALDGVFLCCGRSVAQNVPFDESTFRRFHLYDLDFTFRAFRSGYRLAVINDVPIIHASMGTFGQEWAADADRFLQKHGALLSPKPGRSWNCTLVHVGSKEELAEVMGEAR